MASRICILDDDPAFLQGMENALAGGYSVTACSDVSEFRESFSPRGFDLVVLDMRLKEAKEGLDVLVEIQRLDPYQAVVVATAYADTDTYLEALQAGALLYVDKTLHSPAALALLFDAVIQQGGLRRERATVSRMLERMDPSEIVGSSGVIRTLRSQIAAVADREPAVVLIKGEPGCGKELVARSLHAIHAKGLTAPLSVLPAQNLPSDDIVRLLTGDRNAGGGTHGLLEEAHGAGLVVRCADDQPANVLKFLLGTLRKGSFCRRGEKTSYPFDAVLYLTCEEPDPLLSVLGDIDAEVIAVPPLRDRKEDIPQLAPYLLESYRRRGHESVSTVDPAALSLLLSHHWPGNVSELRLVLEYGALLSMTEGVKTILPSHLPMLNGNANLSDSALRWDLDYQEARTQVDLVESAIEELATSNKTKLAAFLQISTPTTLARRVERSLGRYPQLFDLFPRTAGVFGRAREGLR